VGLAVAEVIEGLGSVADDADLSGSGDADLDPES